MSALDIEDKIETALLTLMNVGYIQTNSVARRKFADFSQNKVLPCAIAHCLPVVSHLGFKTIFNAKMEISAVTQISADASGSACKAIYQELLGMIRGLSAATLTTTIGSGVTVDGILLEEGDKNFSEDGEQRSLKCTANLFLQA